MAIEGQPSTSSDPQPRVGESVLLALEAMARDDGAKERLALASTMSHGEETWRLEIVRALMLMGVSDVAKEQMVSGVPAIDLRVMGEAIEVKSSHSGFAIRNSAATTQGWFGKDVAKLQRLSVPGHQLITLATMVTAVNARWPSVNQRGDALPNQWQDDRTQALSKYTAYAEPVSLGPIHHVDLGEGLVPGNGTIVYLDALLYCVHQPSPDS